MTKFAAVSAAGLVSALLGACAGSPDAAYDPYEAANRQAFVMNQRVDRSVLRPLAESYVVAVPEAWRGALHNLLTTANQPVVFANTLLQGRPRAAGETMLRFSVNVGLGFAGMDDIASRLRLPEHRADFGQTLAVWGWSDRPYLMLPLIGPCNPRDAVGYAGDIALDPGFIIQYKHYLWWIGVRKGLDILDARAGALQNLDDIERASIDYYAAVRSFYRQHRASQTEGEMLP